MAGRLAKLKRVLTGPASPLWEDGERAVLFGIPFTKLPLQELARLLISRLENGDRGIVVTTPDAWATSRAILAPELGRIYEESDYVTCDGSGVFLASRILGRPVPRTPGVDLAWELCRLVSQRGLSVYLLGGRPGVAERAARRLSRAFPGIEVVGAHQGYFQGAGPWEEIRNKRPDLLLVGMGFPRQEQWILAHRHSGAGVLLGVGATLDFWAGRVPRAPKFVRSLGLEWIWRAAVQPRRIARLWCIPFLLYQTAVARLRLWLSP